MKTILDPYQLNLTIQRLAYEIIERHSDLDNTVLIGIQPRGVFLSDRIAAHIRHLVPSVSMHYGKLDITFYRDDVRSELHEANKTDIPFSIEDKKVVLIDDVLHKGRTIRAALDALLAFGRPDKVELCVLIDRRFSRELPIQPDYCGKAIDSIISQKVKVEWDKEEVVLY
ncbi:bifunctional pyr operon transcriptional regulator/uracil phosphoribosyltransferase PyrR [Agriterribacter sp.]|uniref:bifunctional pyr operon transcriptional regulator/uracil phosphoribosyltransferase PyrR n=1 Tax=Agriterribacter sp. TaxID=2821509 RepID=UPI002B5786A5|nr:bifunctional pyr operon transcriptional regulator/uracil phosphoribosyltransferase PyrR [Agriterribacter sp.]HRP54886.1 bifunctional pyr operon transcriptional regulator/uracil phosphoribosyltransferase PyrR [Agriterribacter sp.]